MTPLCSDAQTERKLINKVKEIYSLAKGGEEKKDPKLLIDAIKNIIKEKRIRPMRPDHIQESLGFEEQRYFDLDYLYNKVLIITRESDSKTRKKLIKLQTKINDWKKRANITTMNSNLGFDGIEVSTYTVLAGETIPIEYLFEKGNFVKFYVEIGSDFLFKVQNNGENINLKSETIGNQQLYTFVTLQKDHYQVYVTNTRAKKVECILLKHIK